jgi:diguanylate cyclase (GGDEF)-like protein
MPENNHDDPEYLVQSRQEIIEEIARLHQTLCAAGQSDHREGHDGLMIIGLCHGLSLEEWENLKREGGFVHWLALPTIETPLPNLTRIQLAMEKLADETRRDPLTGLANRRAFEATMRLELDRSYRSATDLSLAIIDIDNFKSINDTHGHVCGDKVLVDLAHTIHKSTRSYDLAARLGGEEFALILPSTGLLQTERFMLRLLAEIRQRRVVCAESESPVGITVSAGLVCTKGKIPLSVERLVELADKALYEAKRTGKDRVVKAPIPDIEGATEHTLVKVHEKQFLFTGPNK